ncbi:MAG TPA: hypothetical protein VHR66_24930 [Gemmataceae bacterium]|jgi:predicted nucleic acid-binding protein|nr:hypothetical protein [Gemmataceae bacterium]
MFLPDVNVWVAMNFQSHVHYLPARTWLNGLPATSLCFFCRVTQLGFLRLANNAQAFPADALDQVGAWNLYDRVRGLPQIALADEPPGLEATWR